MFNSNGSFTELRWRFLEGESNQLWVIIACFLFRSTTHASYASLQLASIFRMRTERARRDRHISTSEACHSIISTSFEGRSRGCETGFSLDQALFSESQSPQSADELVVPPNVYLKSYSAGRKNPLITSYMMKQEKLQKDLRD